LCAVNYVFERISNNSFGDNIRFIASHFLILELRYNEVDWDKLLPDVKTAVETLGFTKEIWDSEKNPSSLNNREWDDLSPEESAAGTVLGYSEDNWEK